MCTLTTGTDMATRKYRKLISIANVGIFMRVHAGIAAFAWTAWKTNVPLCVYFDEYKTVHSFLKRETQKQLCLHITA